MTKFTVELSERSYPIHIGAGLLSRAGEYFNLNRRVLLLTDAGVPAEYSQAVAAQVTGEARIHTVPVGEGSKSLSTLEEVLTVMSEMRMGRRDCVVAVGGGVVGDLAGFAAAVYMRGIEFYNIPSTLLAMVDSSIGGKTAVNLGGVKNIVGAFHQPSGVLIDPEVLATLDSRLCAEGLCEAIKMAATSNAELFEYFENSTPEEVYSNIEWVITEALRIKKAVVECDEREGGLRRVLNFGHTFGHGIEAERRGRLYHGECVALGMLPMCSEGVRGRLSAVLRAHGLPTEYSGDLTLALEYASHDKKAQGGGVDAVIVDKIGTHRIERLDAAALAARVGAVFGIKG